MCLILSPQSPVHADCKLPETGAFPPHLNPAISRRVGELLIFSARSVLLRLPLTAKEPGAWVTAVVRPLPDCRPAPTPDQSSIPKKLLDSLFSVTFGQETDFSFPRQHSPADH